MEQPCYTPAKCSAQARAPVVKVIVNADDFGVSHQVNEAILDLIGTRRIMSTTILANGPAVEEAARRAPQWPECSFGAHLNLTEFRPLSRDAALLLGRGRAEMSREHLERTWPTPRMLQAVYDEFCLQIQKLFDLGVVVSHIDSHQHAHTIPWLFPALKAVQKRFGIRHVRASRNIYNKAETVSAALLLKKRVFNWGLRGIYGSRVPDGFTDLPTLLESGAEFAGRYRWIEVMVHPGALNHEKETALLRSRWMDSIPFAVELQSYHEL